jgi:rod shape-determining protein MreD
MNNTVLINSFRFILFAFLQIVLFNHIHLFGYATPLPYILFILLYPLHSNRKLLLICSFLLGLIIDIFNNSGGVHTTACLFIAFFRDSFLKISYGVSYEYHMIKITEKISKELITYILLSVLIHHFIFYALEIFNFEFILEILLKTVSSTVITSIFCFILIAFLKPNRS